MANKSNEQKSLKHYKGIDLPQRRFGLIAIERGFIKADQLYEALMRQRAQETGGAERRPLGMILKDLDYLSVSQTDEILITLEAEARQTKKDSVNVIVRMCLLPIF
jgi:hypothetical protein